MFAVAPRVREVDALHPYVMIFEEPDHQGRLGKSPQEIELQNLVAFRRAGSLNFTNWLALSIIASVCGTLGDLIESKFKRQAGVKDSGVIMPGHGGLLDRLDSIIFAAPFFYLFLRLFPYVT